MDIKKDDMVLVISGNDRGKKGRVLKVFPKQNRIVVEGINFIKRHTKPNQVNPQGGIIEKEGVIHVSNVMLLCPVTGKPTRIGHKQIKGAKRKEWVRYSKKSGEII
ncbi:50S ribosomal protein L24 [bacterium SM23_57]|nr:MAG: 50S ribosomal protein L24 [bacterium SM23_57]